PKFILDDNGQHPPVGHMGWSDLQCANGGDFCQIIALLLPQAELLPRWKLTRFNSASRAHSEFRGRNSALRHDPINDLLWLNVDGIGLHSDAPNNIRVRRRSHDCCRRPSPSTTNTFLTVLNWEIQTPESSLDGKTVCWRVTRSRPRAQRQRSEDLI